MRREEPDRSVTVGTPRAYGMAAFVRTCKAFSVEAHVARNTSGRRSNIGEEMAASEGIKRARFTANGSMKQLAVERDADLLLGFVMRLDRDGQQRQSSCPPKSDTHIIPLNPTEQRDGGAYVWGLTARRGHFGWPPLSRERQRVPPWAHGWAALDPPHLGVSAGRGGHNRPSRAKWLIWHDTRFPTMGIMRLSRAPDAWQRGPWGMCEAQGRGHRPCSQCRGHSQRRG